MRSGFNLTRVYCAGWHEVTPVGWLGDDIIIDGSIKICFLSISMPRLGLVEASSHFVFCLEKCMYVFEYQGPKNSYTLGL